MLSGALDELVHVQRDMAGFGDRRGEGMSGMEKAMSSASPLPGFLLLLPMLLLPLLMLTTPLLR